MLLRLLLLLLAFAVAIDETAANAEIVEAAHVTSDEEIVTAVPSPLPAPATERSSAHVPHDEVAISAPTRGGVFRPPRSLR